MKLRDSHDWIEYGRDVERRYERGMRVDGRPMTNIEMYALIRLHDHEIQRRIERDGCCCDEGPHDDGHCRLRGGMCALFQQAKRMAFMHEKELERGN